MTAVDPTVWRDTVRLVTSALAPDGPTLAIADEIAASGHAPEVLAAMACVAGLAVGAVAARTGNATESYLLALLDPEAPDA